MGHMPVPLPKQDLAKIYNEQMISQLNTAFNIMYLILNTDTNLNWDYYAQGDVTGVTMNELGSHINLYNHQSINPS